MVLIFDRLDNKSNKLKEYKLSPSNKTNTKNVMLEYLKFIGNKLEKTKNREPFTPPKETISDTVKKKEKRKQEWNQNLNSKQTIN